ncbi:glycine oxidase ThiO [Paenibacillus sp. XY044]|uniref:glycine oxidase ThiO n=1 Tax=Paenibacillus sp. XY044 TaxID=2026089 RepID=UPI000B99CC42|nr:glycine oxidase ThiO [Paenibacillus sp. XY044]OZB96408.1 glycine oxidase ThiO [Paenibacillus sp. XY044]
MNGDIIVMGGGIIGLSCALELRRRGLNVTLLEKGHCGGQASGAAAGMLAPYSENVESPDEFFRLCRESLSLYPQWQQAVKDISGVPFEYAETGSLYIARHEADLLALESRLEWQRRWGSGGEILTGSALFDAEPGLAQGAVAALRTPAESHVYAPDLTEAVKRACLVSGVQIHEYLGRIELTECQKGVALLAGNGERFVGDQLLISTGAWIQELSETLGIRIPVYPIRGQICAYAWGEEREPLRHLVFTSQGYLVQKANGTLVCGASEDIAGFDTTVTDKGIRRLTEWNKQVLPALGEVQPFHRWAGLRPAVLDGRPLIGRLDDAGHIFAAAGHYRNGILLSPVTAALIADSVEGKQLPEWFGAFRPNRFGEVQAGAFS